MRPHKIQRAKQLTLELRETLKCFLDTVPFGVATKVDPNTDRRIYYLSRVGEVPVEISLITGDILQNLRSALDHLAYQLYVKGTGSRQGGRRVYFPIADDYEGFQKKKPRQTSGMLPNAIAKIEALKPYRGGNDILWRLHQLNNVDKHRLLLTAGSSFRSFDLGAHMQQSMPEHLFPPGFKLELFLKPKDSLFPLQVGTELFIDTQGERQKEITFRFDISLNEKGINEAQPVLEMVETMTVEVEKVIQEFEQLTD